MDSTRGLERPPANDLLPRVDVAAAPAYKVPPRKVVAVEHPLIIKNIENGIKTFGTNRPFERVVETIDPDECLPLYLRHNDPMCVPILSYNAPTNNVLLKITVPKRIGRKRKRRDLDPSHHTEAAFSPIPEQVDAVGGTRSQSRNDNPVELLRTLKENVGNYSIEAVAEITHTHRFKGVTDFHHSTSNTDFFSRFRDTVLKGHAEGLRDFKLDQSRGTKPNDQFMPPPRLSSHSVPINWGWHQNPNVQYIEDPATGETVLVNRAQKFCTKVEYLSHDVEQIPDRAKEDLPSDPHVRSLITHMQEALEERPIWTRRALLNRVSHSPYIHLNKFAFPHVCYQFKTGAWREAIVKFGVDPRTDPKYRIYQTLFFKVEDEEEQSALWQDRRSTVRSNKFLDQDITSHMFDGKNISLDGKVWQVCDITDPLLARLCHEAPYLPTCDTKIDGWFLNGSYAKIKHIMKTKLISLRFGKPLKDEEFKELLAKPDYVPRKTSRSIYLPVPDLDLTEQEAASVGLDYTRLQKKKGPNANRRDRIVTARVKGLPYNATPRLPGLPEEEESTMPGSSEQRLREAVAHSLGGRVGTPSSVGFDGPMDEDMEDEDGDEGDEDAEGEDESGSEEEFDADETMR